jgi:thioredoxin 1
MRILKFYGETCGPCQVLEGNLNSLNIEHESINIEDEQAEELIIKYGIRGIPTLVILDDDGNVLKKHTGLLNINDLKTFIQ